MLPEDEVLGAVGFTEMVVRPGDTSVAIGIGDLPIIAPSLLINLMEHAAILSLDLYLEPGETTIPISVEFISLSPAGIGASLRGTSRVIEIAGKDGFVFDSEHDEYESDPYHLLNAYYSHSFNKVNLGFYAKNILDENYADRGFIFGLEPPLYEEKLFKSFAPPREIGMSLTYSF